MFVGHFALALGAKKVAPEVKLGTLVMAAQWLDLIWPIFLLLHLEVVRPAPGDTRFTPLDFVSYPYTHSLLMSLVWAVLLGVVFFTIRKNRRGAIVVTALVASHWVLDWITHRPDLPLYPGGPKVGLGLWNSVEWTLFIELILFSAGTWIYASSTKTKDRVGGIALWSFVAFLLAVYVLSAVGSEAPQPNQIAWAGLLMWLFVPWGYWIDRHREMRGGRLLEMKTHN